MTIEQPDWMRFLTSEGLAEKAGCPKDMFPEMIAKEFADNAADIGGYSYQINQPIQKLVISNGGEGISSDDVAKIFSINYLTRPHISLPKENSVSKLTHLPHLSF
jgi:hypothetical protein